MNASDWQTEEFERHRRHLRAVAYRMLGSLSDADDVRPGGVAAAQPVRRRRRREHARLAHDRCRARLPRQLRARKARREDGAGAWLPEPIVRTDDETDPEQETLLADSVGLALLVVLETLTPAERLAFVLHDMFALPFEEIAPIVGRSPAAARQLASRARRRVRGATLESDVDLAAQRRVVDAFLAASRAGDFDALVAVLDPDVVFRVDRGSLPVAARLPAVVRGPEGVASVILERGAPFAAFARPAVVNGAAGLIIAPATHAVAVIGFTVADGRIVEIDLIADADKLRGLSVDA